MTPPVRRGVRRRGWLALAVSLALHGGFVWVLTRLPGRADPLRAPEGGPVIAYLIAEEETEPDVQPFLLPRPGKTPSTGDEAPREVGVRHADENIVPAAHHTEPASTAGQVDVAAFAQGAGHGAGSPAGFFEIGAPPRSVVYVLDRSASMGPRGLLAAATRELCASLARLPAATRFQIVVYHDQAERLLPGPLELLPASRANTERAAELLDALRAEGGTGHLKALRLALSLGTDVIYLLTDADDLSDADRREVTRLNRGRTVIHTVELNTANRGRADMPLQVLARENRGRYRAVDLASPR